MEKVELNFGSEELVFGCVQEETEYAPLYIPGTDILNPVRLLDDGSVEAMYTYLTPKEL